MVAPFLDGSLTTTFSLTVGNIYFCSLISTVQREGTTAEPVTPYEIVGQYLEDEVKELTTFSISSFNEQKHYGVTLICESWT